MIPTIMEAIKITMEFEKNFIIQNIEVINIQSDNPCHYMQPIIPEDVSLTAIMIQTPCMDVIYQLTNLFRVGIIGQ